MITDIEKINELVRHLNSVQEAGVLLGTRLIEKGFNKLGIALIGRCYCHDVSKFGDFEFEFISHHIEITDENKEKVQLAVRQHQASNQHHPEFHPNGIVDMSELDIGEFVCDVYSRSASWGLSLQTFIDEEATVKYGFKKNDKTYRKIMFFVKLLLGKQFKKLSKPKKPKEQKEVIE